MNDISHVCSMCHERFTSAQSMKGQCSVCGAAICYKCWALDRRTCAEHGGLGDRVAASPVPAVASSSKSAGKSAIGLVCLRCGQKLSHTTVRCPAKPYCAPCQRALCNVPDRLPEGAVTIDEARYLEHLFHRFTEDALRKAYSWPAEMPLRRRKIRKTGDSALGVLPDGFISTHPYGDAIEERLKQMPANRTATFAGVYRKGRIPCFGKKRVITFVVASYVDLPSVIEQGYVSGTAGARELNAVLPLEGGTPNIVFAFSPVGWTETLGVPNGLVLVGPIRDGGWRTRHALRDEAARNFVERLFSTETDAEKIARCCETLLGASGSRFPLSARETARTQELPVHVVAQAFRRIANTRKGYVVCDDPGQDDWLLDIR